MEEGQAKIGAVAPRKKDCYVSRTKRVHLLQVWTKKMRRNVSQCNVCIVGKIRVRVAEFLSKDALLRTHLCCNAGVSSVDC
jgi:hypothetical protein